MACGRGAFAVVFGLLAVAAGFAAGADLCGELGSTTLSASEVHTLSCQATVKAGSVLKIEAGVTIEAAQAATLNIERGAKIEAIGTPDMPITFTVQNAPDSRAPGFVPSSVRGLWGGLVINGAQTEDDDSGSLQYVRVWHGTNGIVFNGVGSGTEIHHIEAAFNLGNGITFNGGSAGAKYVSALYNGGNGINMANGFSGKLQFVYIMTGVDGKHAIEIEKLEAIPEPGSGPAVFNALAVGGSSREGVVVNEEQKSGLVLLREGTGGHFGNMILMNVPADGYGVRVDDCTSGSVTQDDVQPGSNALYWSRRNIIHGGKPQWPWNLNGNCGSLNEFDPRDPDLVMIGSDMTSTPFVDPRPFKYALVNNPTYQMIDPVPDDGWFIQPDFKGAFAYNDLWLQGWSWLEDNLRIPAAASIGQRVRDNITSETVWSGDILLTRQVFVREGTALVIRPGTTIRAYGDDGSFKPPSLIIERGAKIYADGSPLEPITFTSAVDLKHLPARGLWGGLVVLGNAQTYTEHIEIAGIPGSFYGGTTVDETSGVLRYVRVWYGGAHVGEDHKISGLTLAGVGQETDIEFIEAAYNLDDGISFWGGTANVRYLSSVFNGDDGIDTDEGYRGRIQFAAVFLGQNGGHGAEMDSEVGGNSDSVPRSFPQIYNALFVGGGGAPVTSENQLSGIMHMASGTGGKFGNLMLANIPEVAVLQTACGSELRTQEETSNFYAMLPSFLYFSNNTLMRSSPSLLPFAEEAPCTGMPLSKAIISDNMGLRELPEVFTETSGVIDPRAVEDGPAYQNVDQVPTDGFFEQTDFKGAFGRTNWMSGWSILTVSLFKMPNDPESLTTIVRNDITSDITWQSYRTYIIIDDVTVRNGATLTLEPGTTIKSGKSTGRTATPVLRVEPGSNVVAGKDTVAYTVEVPESSPPPPPPPPMIYPEEEEEEEEEETSGNNMTAVIAAILMAVLAVSFCICACCFYGRSNFYKNKYIDLLDADTKAERYSSDEESGKPAPEKIVSMSSNPMFEEQQ